MTKGEKERVADASARKGKTGGPKLTWSNRMSKYGKKLDAIETIILGRLK